MKSKSNFIYGLLLGLLGIVLFSSKAVMVKLAYQYQVDPLSILLLRMVFSFPFYVIVAVIYGKSSKEVKVQRKDYIWLIFFGFVGYYLASYFDFEGLRFIKASLERIILFVYPTLVIIFNRVFFKNPIKKYQVWAILLSYFGIVLAFWQEVGLSGSDTYKGGLLVLLSAITYAAYLVGSGWLLPKFGTMRFTAYAMIISCICVFIHFGLVSKVNILNFPWQVYVLGLMIAIFATVIPSFLVSESIKRINASNFAIVAGMGPISTIILAAIFLQEQLTVLQFVGTFVVIFGIVLVSRKKSKENV